MDRLLNWFQKSEYEFFMKELARLWLYGERHWGDYIQWDLASIRIDIKTDLSKKELEKKLELILDHEIWANLSWWKKEKYSWLKTYLLSFEVLIP